MWYRIEIKTDKQKTWRKLSIKMRSLDVLKADLEFYVIIFAEDNQLNHHSVMARILDENDNVVHTRLSNAEANKVYN